MSTKEEQAKRSQLVGRILERRNYLFHTDAERYQISSPPVRFWDYGQPLLYSIGGLLFALVLFRVMGPTEGIVITSTSLLGLMYTWLLYNSKAQLFKTVVEISQEGLKIKRPDQDEVFIPSSAADDFSILLDPEEKVKTGLLKLASAATGEVEILKLTGENQKFIKDDLEKVRDFILYVWFLDKPRNLKSVKNKNQRSL